ncbi:Nlp family transcriptional regulator [Humitalea rosea]|uniref:Nlp family transcriptional regulator n=1 Tax=Humitalea rosea TaxID=990373 RepID=A0A2W7IJI9_9PROT|nr:Nlp family transcriptional regulator [Humitalea rosea]
MAEPGWHREDIKAALVKRFGPVTALSEAWGWEKSAISRTLRGSRRRRPVELRIAEALGIPPEVLWPDRWPSPEGKRRRPNSVIAQDTSRGRPDSHRQKSEAA